jgi:hypothetical protein
MENRHNVSLVVTTPLAAVEQRLRDVENWAGFLIDVGQISRVSHERYTFRIVSGNHDRQVPVAVREHPQHKCFVWTALRGPSFDGTIRLAEVEGGWTRVTVSLTRWPDGFLAGLTDMLPGRDRPGVAEDALRNLLQPATSSSPAPS